MEVVSRNSSLFEGVEKLRVYSERECDLHCEDGVPCTYYDTETCTCQWSKRAYKENK